MSEERRISPYGKDYWTGLGVDTQGFDVLDRATEVVNSHIAEVVKKNILLAEQLRGHESGHCYCKSCLRQAADKANNDVLWALGLDRDSQVTAQQWDAIKPFWYMVIPNGKRGFQIVREGDIKPPRPENWVTDRLNGVSGPLSDVGNIT